MDELALFAGAGGGILGGHLLGWRTRCAVELDPYATKVLLARQRDGMLPRFPIWNDVSTFDGKPWRGHIDVISGGFPCQDISAAGSGAGITGTRSGLWSEMARIVGEVVPRYVFVENSPMLTSRGLGVVLGDLASMGYNARWGVLGAHHVGAPHKRDRIWILATYAHSKRGRAAKISLSECIYQAQSWNDGDTESMAGSECALWPTKPGVFRVSNGVANRVDRLRAIGNGQVPAVAALAWRMLSRGGP